MRRVLMLLALACRAATGLQLEESIPDSDEFLVSRPIILWAVPPPESNLNPPSGECVEGKCKSGHGKFIWGSLDVYEGDWDDQIRPHGKGVYTWHDGESYDGDWVHGIKEGKGVFWYKNGAKYTGKWKNDVQWGEDNNYALSSGEEFKIDIPDPFPAAPDDDVPPAFNE